MFVHKDLKNSNYVFLRKDHVKKVLERPYYGPFEVLEKTDETMTLKVRQGEREVSIDRVKPGYFEAPTQQPLNRG